MVDIFFEKGRYFPGLGLFASSVYEAAGQEEKAVFAAFLDYEYSGGYRQTDTSAFIKNIDTLEQQLASGDKLTPVAGALNLVRSLYDPSTAVDPQYEPSFFAGKYITLKKKISDAAGAAIHTTGAASLTTAEFNRYLTMEHYFSSFPVYYWNIWQAISDLPVSSRANYLPVLQRIIALDMEGTYAERAWDEISKILGFRNREE
ncbi:hypothetical protein FACS1894140_5470 [Spirochaetia bacterium]|nr:hypothetical protein FACS1894140_5470 [Spirochaetia bacterium]